MDCNAPGCTDDAQYKEPVGENIKNDPELNNHLEVCQRHVDPTKDGIEKL